MPCAAATRWRHDAATSEVVSVATGLCADVETGGTVGTYTCGSGQGLKQLNQEWAVDGSSGVLVVFSSGDCMTAVPA